MNFNIIIIQQPGSLPASDKSAPEAKVKVNISIGGIDYVTNLP